MKVQLPGAMDGPVAKRSSAGEAKRPRGKGHGVIEEEADESCEGGPEVGDVSLLVQFDCEREREREKRGLVSCWEKKRELITY